MSSFYQWDPELGIDEGNVEYDRELLFEVLPCSTCTGSAYVSFGKKPAGGSSESRQVRRSR